MIATMKRSLWVGIAVALMLSIGVLVAQATHADKPAEEPKKVFVCKYVGTPHVDERLQTGQNPISVAVSSIQNNQWNGVVPGWFSDAHDRSYVLMYDTTGNGGGQQGEPTIEDCPAPETPHNAYASVIITPATCDAPAKLTYGPAIFATYSGTANNTTGGPTPYNVLATADAGHLFNVNGLSTLSWSGTLAAKLPAQSSDPKADCFNPPVVRDDIVKGDWVDGEILCDATTVTQTRTVTTTPRSWQFVNGEWVIVNGTPVVTTETQTRALTEEEMFECPTEEPNVATAGVKILDATCEAGEKLTYVNVKNASATQGSTPDGTFGQPTPYSVTFVADEGADFVEDAKTSFQGTLAGPDTGEDCVLGETTTTPTPTPTTPSTPAVLPATTGESTAAIVLGGSLLAVVLGLAGARRFLARSL